MDETPKIQNEPLWRDMLTGEMAGLQRMRRVMGWIPSDPRCKFCDAPFGRPGSFVLRFLGFGPSTLNRRLCRMCLRSFEKQPGGAEVEISLMFADVRGSTALAERTAPQQFSRLMARFYGTAARVIDKRGGIVDKFVGDEVVALFIPGLAGRNHAAHAVESARDLLRETSNDGPEPWIPVGAGVHTGVAYVGTVGEGDAVDFTALGDAVNTTARLASAAGSGELLVSTEAASAARLDTSGLESRSLALRGHDHRFDAWVTRAGEAVPMPSS